MSKIDPKLFEHQNDTLSIQKFGEWFFEIKPTFWDLIDVKNELIKLHPDDAPENKTISFVDEMIHNLFAKEIEAFEQKIKNNLVNLTNREAILYLAKEFDWLREDMNKQLEEEGYELYKNTFNIELYDKSGKLLQPLWYYQQQYELVNRYIDKYKYEIFIYEAPIINRVYESLRDFGFKEWTDRVLREAPEKKLPYFIELKSAIQRFEDDARKENKNQNFFPITRLQVWDEKNGRYDGPSNNYLNFLNWLDIQIDFCKNDNTIELNALKINNNKNLKISEKTWLLSTSKDNSILDVTFDNKPIKDKTIKSEDINNDVFINAFCKKMIELPFSKRKKFIDYQVEMRNDKMLFLEELLDVITEYESQLILTDKRIIEDYKPYIEAKIEKLNQFQNKSNLNYENENEVLNNNPVQILQLPPNFKLTSKEINKKIETLNIYQTALLFHYLQTNGLVLPYTNSSYSEFIYSLTGHSKHNLANKKGFGVIEWIKQDKQKDSNKSHIKNYNLEKVKQALVKIINEIDEEIKKNESKKK